MKKTWNECQSFWSIETQATVQQVCVIKRKLQWRSCVMDISECTQPHAPTSPCQVALGSRETCGPRAHVLGDGAVGRFGHSGGGSFNNSSALSNSAFFVQPFQRNISKWSVFTSPQEIVVIHWLSVLVPVALAPAGLAWGWVCLRLFFLMLKQLLY